MIVKVEIEKYFADYLEGNLGSNESKELFDFLMKNPELKKEFDELKQLFEDLPDKKHPELGKTIDKNFYDFLEKEKNISFKILKNWTSIIKYAALLFVIGGAYFLGYSNSKTVISYRVKPIYLTRSSTEIGKEKSTLKVAIPPKSPILSKEKLVLEEIREIKNDLAGIQDTQKKMILSMLNRESAVDRLFAINSSFELQAADETLLFALVKTLDYDPSFNVRLAAVDALARFNKSNYTRNALINSLLKQNEPSLQMALMELLINLKERKAINAFSTIIESSESPEYVKEKAEKGLKILTM